jgi:hypothetical protein
MKHLLITTIAAVLLATTAFADPIHDIAWKGDLAGVQAELDKGVDANAKDADGQTPLHFAAYYGHKEIVELLLANGADVNAKDRGGSTPLHFAAWLGYKEIAELLITEGADVNAKERYIGSTSLHYAAVVRTGAGVIKSNVVKRDARHATLEIVDGKGVITNTGDRRGGIHSKGDRVGPLKASRGQTEPDRG